MGVTVGSLRQWHPPHPNNISKGGEDLQERQQQIRQIQELQSLVVDLERERLARPPEEERRPARPPSRKRWEANNPTVTFRTTLEMKARLNDWREKGDLSFFYIMMGGLERLEQLELVNVLKIRLSQEKNNP